MERQRSTKAGVLAPLRTCAREGPELRDSGEGVVQDHGGLHRAEQHHRLVRALLPLRGPGPLSLAQGMLRCFAELCAYAVVLVGCACGGCGVVPVLVLAYMCVLKCVPRLALRPLLGRRARAQPWYGNWSDTTSLD